ncbi:type II toxin-antitoxin system YafQ family toxin [Pedobacter sp. AW1-32]|uniref:type II toxin-antitoxin system YafQ family toxin n=1 Tax=Pedobacter sp. AW1-32 TaxID=3383026 RepID=UPI003FEE9323
MYEVSFSTQFKKDYKRCVKRNYEISALETALKLLRETGTLPNIYKPHLLSGNYSGFWECHIKSDWLLIWLQEEETKRIFISTD